MIVVGRNGGMNLASLVHAMQYFAYRLQETGDTLMKTAPCARRPAGRFARFRGSAGGIFHDLLLEKNEREPRQFILDLKLLPHNII
ncbi:hypothetical protein predicted by Glimmer/Critica [Bordetella petrii]|uniref:Uncharacterized protein n=1 Tax=Bordetella petrii (strain ATCC BAA-461 / DSM 12804 / CCUG 43448 / CIP 107267 / Se-1111R) TaxID=340100 RepID=A9IRF9_BORPD|nr:hypothetical protein predicted by Glimmer/Critica [Bordetella petrii]